MPINWKRYGAKEGVYDELIKPGGRPRHGATALVRYLGDLTGERLARRQRAAERAIVEMGITFTIYSEGANIDRAWPFDIVPRTIAWREWSRIQKGLKQRLRTLNLFIDDLYNDQQVVADGVFPQEVLDGAKGFLEPCVGVSPPLGVWAHVCGSDLVRGGDGTVFVLEDNLRVPSGVSYMLENRIVTKQVFPELFRAGAILPVDDYPSQLLETLSALSPRDVEEPRVVVLTPGIYNSAYFEHAYLAQRMGADLVEGADLEVGRDHTVYVRTVRGRERVDVIYRRINDTSLDPRVLDKDSLLGVPGLIESWRRGRVALANAPGSGVADDKVVYAYVPDLIRYYLGEEPIIPNVPTYLCSDDRQREYVLDHLHELVVKPANESGGYGLLIGPQASQAKRNEFARLIRNEPRNYIAQPTLDISTAPTLIDNELVPRHVDLRPFILQGQSLAVTAGGLTRVALPEGSLVVNSSQGGGSKDTWIVGRPR